MEVNKWLLFYVNVFLLVLFLPPVAVILMTSPTLVTIIVQAGFEPIRFGMLLTIFPEIAFWPSDFLMGEAR